MTATDEVQATLRLLNSDRYAESRAAPGSLVELLARHAQGALDVSGAEQTAWNGQVVEAGEGILGLAQWDGTLHLDRECILEPLREMYSHAGEPQSDGTLVRYREALVSRDAGSFNDGGVQVGASQGGRGASMPSIVAGLQRREVPAWAPPA